MTTPANPIDLGATLRALRRRADLSQRELAARAEVPASTVARIESGTARNPRFRTVERLVAAAGGARVLIDEPDLPYQFFGRCGFYRLGPQPAWLLLAAPSQLVASGWSGQPGRGGGEGGERLPDPPG